jgi:hypothetical protein
VGGAIGIAALGSIVNSIYRSHLASALVALPPAAKEAASRNVAGALFVGRSLPTPELQAQIKVAVQQSFVDGVHVALRVAAVIVVLGGLTVGARLPDGDQHATH